MEQDLQRHVHSDRETAIAALGEAAELWNAAWEARPNGGRLHLPVLAGIRRGRVMSGVEVAESADGCSIRLHIESAEYEVNRPALLMLLMGALGGIVTAIWPLAPKRLLGFVPLGIVLMIGAWLLVASRVRSAGPREFLETVAEIAEGEMQLEEDPGARPT